MIAVMIGRWNLLQMRYRFFATISARIVATIRSIQQNGLKRSIAWGWNDGCARSGIFKLGYQDIISGHRTRVGDQ